MKEYNVTITETLCLTVSVEAKDRAQAEAIVRNRWKDGDYIMNDHFAGVKIHADDGPERDEPPRPMGREKNRRPHKSYGHDDR